MTRLFHHWFKLNLKVFRRTRLMIIFQIKLKNWSRRLKSLETVSIMKRGLRIINKNTLYIKSMIWWVKTIKIRINWNWSRIYGIVNSNNWMVQSQKIVTWWKEWVWGLLKLKTLSIINRCMVRINKTHKTTFDGLILKRTDWHKIVSSITWAVKVVSRSPPLAIIAFPPVKRTKTCQFAIKISRLVAFSSTNHSKGSN